MKNAQVTEAHRVLARHLSTEAESVPHLCDLMAQAIADSEARTIAAAVAPLEARIKSDEELFHDIRMKLTASCGDPYKLHDEALDAIIAERDQLRAEVERLTAACDKFSNSEIFQGDWKARAERAEAELAATMQVGGFAYFTEQRDAAERRAHNAEYLAKKAEAELATKREKLSTLREACGHISYIPRIQSALDKTAPAPGALT